MVFLKPHRHINRVFLHCSASDYDHHDDISVIKKWHVEENGWSDVGYHFFIKSTGEVQIGRSLERTPAAQKGHNAHTIAICLHGKTKFTPEQFRSLRHLCDEINRSYNSITFHGHNEVAPGRECPVYNPQAVLGLDENGRMV